MTHASRVGSLALLHAALALESLLCMSTLGLGWGPLALSWGVSVLLGSAMPLVHPLLAMSACALINVRIGKKEKAGYKF